MIPEIIAFDDISHWAPPGSCRALLMLRLDAIHPVVSGNKWYKLKYNIDAAISQGKTSLLSFGGGYSNHLVATAFVARQHGLKSIGIVRGNYETFTPTLMACVDCGMQLIPFTKDEYAASANIISEEMRLQFPDAFIIPEGGANELGIRGAAEVASLIPAEATDVCVAVGTGTTLAGLQRELPASIRLHGFCAAKKCHEAVRITQQVEGRDTPVIHQVHDPRFGKWTESLLHFMKDFQQRTNIQLDVVYTAKMMQKVSEMLADGRFGKDSRVICIHTGGLQGNPTGLFAV